MVGCMSLASQHFFYFFIPMSEYVLCVPVCIYICMCVGAHAGCVQVHVGVQG